MLQHWDGCWKLGAMLSIVGAPLEILLMPVVTQALSTWNASLDQTEVF